MNIAERMVADLKAIENDLGNPVFSWKGFDYPCVPGSAQRYTILTEGGFVVNLNLVLKVRREVFADGVLPKSNDTISYRGDRYKIYSIDKDPFFATMLKILLTEFKGV